MFWPDHLWQHKWSGGTIYAWHNWSGRTTYAPGPNISLQVQVQFQSVDGSLFCCLLTKNELSFCYFHITLLNVFYSFSLSPSELIWHRILGWTQIEQCYLVPERFLLGLKLQCLQVMMAKIWHNDVYCSVCFENLCTSGVVLSNCRCETNLECSDLWFVAHLISIDAPWVTLPAKGYTMVRKLYGNLIVPRKVLRTLKKFLHSADCLLC